MNFNELQEKVLAIWNAHPRAYELSLGRYYRDNDFKNFLNYGSRYSIPIIDEVQFIEQDGGGEGGAEGCISVIKVEGVFYQVFYTYYSHQGFSFDGASLRVVHPVEKTITVYEP